MIIRRICLCIAFATLLFGKTILNAQTPVLKVDLNIGTRQEAEVNEPGYTPWPINGGFDSLTIEGVKIAFKNGYVGYGWYKAGVQAPYYARVANDGITTSNVEMHITGLQNGKHSLVTFHNTFDNPETNTFSPMDVYINDSLVIDDLELTNRVLSNDAATTVFLEFEVKNNEPVVVRFQSDPPNETASTIITICGFRLNSSDPNKMIKYAYPSDLDEHVDIDNDTLRFYWTPPFNTVAQDVYFGENREDVLLADTNSPSFIGNLPDTFFTRNGFYSMNSYYWRVDPINSSGEKTKGDVYYFKKRIPAFPEADGYGKYALGGRAGKVVYVTNLNDNGPGSFRDAVENDSGPRTILFAVSGLITLNSRLVIRDDYLTVAGQTAPGKGICFRWAPIGVTGDNLIVQNLRVRLGIGVTYDGMGLTGAEFSIIDHCSISWTIDEAFSSRGAKNITLQRTLISEALNAAGHSNYPPGAEHGYAGSIGGDIGSFHHNLLAHCNGRNWSLAGGLDGDGDYAGRLDIFNMLVYNWGSRATDGGAHEVNFVNNYYKKGDATLQNTILRAQLEGVGGGTQSYYFNGNVVENKDGTFACDGTDNTCSRTYELSNGQILDWEVFVDEPFFPSEATIDDAYYAYKKVLSDVGSVQPAFDDHDIRIIDETLNGKYSLTGSVTGKKGFPDHEKDAGYWEVYPGYLRDVNWDTDLDGLPNWWEVAHGLDTNSASDDFSETNADLDLNGYTNLEEYLQWMDRPHYFLNNTDNITFDLSDYTRGFTNSPVFEITNILNGDAILESGTSLVTFTPSVNGLGELEFNVVDEDASSMTRKIGFYKGQILGDSMFTYTYLLDRAGTMMVTVDSVNTVTPVTNIAFMPADDIIHIYPNPAYDILNISLKSYEKSSIEYNIMDMTGRYVYNGQTPIFSSDNQMQINVSGLPAGLYLLNIYNSEFRKTIRFIKE
ncbi:MAG: T9SS type A sorting domain-containing protein [Bacteroidales bacterium]|nr:T9SS type A sorting domain-containing protein [Bacteroidales bacterium]